GDRRRRDVHRPEQDPGTVEDEAEASESQRRAQPGQKGPLLGEVFAPICDVLHGGLRVRARAGLTPAVSRERACAEGNGRSTTARGDGTGVHPRPSSPRIELPWLRFELTRPMTFVSSPCLTPGTPEEVTDGGERRTGRHGRAKGDRAGVDRPRGHRVALPP